jgi:hypothetical protein
MAKLNEKRIIIILIFFVMILGIIGLDQIPAGDVKRWVGGAIQGGFFNEDTMAFPLQHWSVQGLMLISGRNPQTVFLNSLIIATITILVLFYFTKEFFGEKVANWTIVIASLSYWRFWGSLSVDTDGNLLSLLTLLSFYCFLKYYEESEKMQNWFSKWLIFTGICLGLLFLTKISAILIILTMVLYDIIKRYILIKKIKNKAKIRSVIYGFLKLWCILFLVSVGIFSIFPLISYINQDSFFIEAISRNAGMIEPRPVELLSRLIQYSQDLFIITPLFLLSLVPLFKNKKKEHEWLLIIYGITVILFYILFRTGPNRNLFKYYIILLPYLSIYSAKFISRYINKKSQLNMIAIGSILSFVVFMFFNIPILGKYLDYNPNSNFIDAIFSLNLSIFVPFINTSTLSGFYINLIIIAFVFLSSLVLFFAFIKMKRPIWLILFLSISFGFNLLLIQSFLFGFPNHNIDKIHYQTTKYLIEMQKNEQGLDDKSIYGFRNDAYDIFVDGDIQSITMITHRNEFNQTFIDRMIDENPLVILVDFPQINKQSLLWQDINQRCIQEKIFYSSGLLIQSTKKKYELGWIYRC